MLDMRKRRLWQWLILSVLVAIGLPTGAHGQAESVPQFAISTTTPTLGERVMVTGSGLVPDSTYYLGIPDAGTLMSYSGVEVGGKPAQALASPYGLSTGANYAINFDEFDQIRMEIEFYLETDAEAPADLSLRFRSFDIYANNGFEFVADQSVVVGAPLSWQTQALLLDKAIGVYGAHQQMITPPTGVTLYLAKVEKTPVWTVQTDEIGEFQAEIVAPRRLNTRQNLPNFSVMLYDDTRSQQYNVGQLVLSPHYENYRTLEELIAFHYVEVRPDHVLTDRSAAVYSNQFAASNSFRPDWEIGYMGGVYEALGETAMLTEQAYRLCNTQSPNGEIGVVRNHSDSAIAGYYTIRPVYEATNDPVLEQCLRLLADYTISNYRADAGVYPQFTDDEYWLDALGIGKTFFLAYMGQRFDNPVWQTAADDITRFALDYMLTDEGWFIHRLNFVTGEVVTDWWIGAQGWALMGLVEYQQWTQDDSLRTQMHEAAGTLANWLVTQPFTRLREDPTRSSQMGYYLRVLGEDDRYDAADRAAWANVADRLFFEAIRDKNTDTNNLNRYGTTTAGTKWAFSDLFLLNYRSLFFPTSTFYINSSRIPYQLNEALPDNRVCQPYWITTVATLASPFHTITADSAGVRLVGGMDWGWLVECVQRPMTIHVDTGTASLQITEWGGDRRAWHLTSENATLSIQVLDLIPNQHYRVLRDGVVLYEQQATEEGGLTLLFSGSATDGYYELGVSN